MKANSTLEGDELVAAEEKFLTDVKSFAESNGKNGNTVRAYMMIAETYFKNADWQNSLDAWVKAGDIAKSYLAGISYYNAAVCYEQLADVVNAEKYYSLALTNEDFELKLRERFLITKMTKKIYPCTSHTFGTTTDVGDGYSITYKRLEILFKLIRQFDLKTYTFNDFCNEYN